MDYKNELELLCDTLKKCHVQFHIVNANDELSRSVYKGIDIVFGKILGNTGTVGGLLGEIEPRTVYKVTDELKLCYLYIKLADSNDEIFVLGPYMPASLTPRQLLEICEKSGISLKNQRYVEEFFLSIPVIDDGNPLLSLLNAFLERIWGQPSFSVVDASRDFSFAPSPINEANLSDEFDDVLLNMKSMELRYSYENEMMQAISLGQIQRTNQLLSMSSEQVFEKRSQDPLRNMKNYCIIMNTLSRKAAENGKVHPMYLDRVSSDFANKIEQLPTVEDAHVLMKDMFKAYCRLVRKHSMKDYSPIVQKAIVLIESDLSANLSLSSISASQSVSAGYLSTVFKNETGKTVTEYIREKRMKHAAHLLSTTFLQIQTVALHCGIMDVQYFSKTFKKYMGMTPKEYRDSTKE